MRILTTIFLLLLTTGEIKACECLNNIDSVRTSFESADLALKGQVISKQIVEMRDTVYDINEVGDTISTQLKLDPNAYLRFTIVVDEYYKGEIKKDTVEIRGPVYSSCMANLDDDGSYFVFASLAEDDFYYSEYCSGNKKFNSNDQRILKELEKGKKTKLNKK